MCKYIDRKLVPIHTTYLHFEKTHIHIHTHPQITSRRIASCIAIQCIIGSDQINYPCTQQYQNQLGTFLGICIIQVGIDRGIRNRSKREVIIIPRPAFPHECVLIAYHRETTYDIECHIGSDLSNNGRWRKDSGFDVSKPRTYHCNRIRRGEGVRHCGPCLCLRRTPLGGLSLPLCYNILDGTLYVLNSYYGMTKLKTQSSSLLIFWELTLLYISSKNKSPFKYYNGRIQLCGFTVFLLFRIFFIFLPQCVCVIPDAPLSTVSSTHTTPLAV